MKSHRPEPFSASAAPAPRWRPVAWMLAGVAIVLAGLLAMVPRAAGAFSLPQPMMVLPPLLLLAFALSLRAWPARRATRPSAPPQPAGPDWVRLSAQASRFFAERGLIGLDPDQPWHVGTDLMLRRGLRTWLVHAGHWQAEQVDAPAVRLLAREVARRGADGGILLCGSDAFTPAACQIARERGILLLDPSQLQRALGHAPAPVHRPARAAPPAPQPARVPVLRPDREVRIPREFQPTEPMPESHRPRPRFAPTEPMAALQAR